MAPTIDGILVRIPRNPRRIPGGDDGIRTHDPLLAGQVLSQLSYTPILGFFPSSLSLSAEDKLPQN